MSPSPSPTLFRTCRGHLARALLVTAASLLGWACADRPAPVGPSGSPSLGKAPGGPSVTSASPSYGHRDTTLNVRVLGSGFSTGAVAEWALGGVPNAAKIRTNSTQFVSSSELVANITIAADADLALWDITVMLIGGKKGVGTELFEVTTAMIIGGGSGIGGYVNGTSEQIGTTEPVSVAGSGALSGTWVYDAISGVAVDLGGGQGSGIDPTGTTVFGRDGNMAAAVWNRGANGTWTKQLLPNPQAQGNATSAAVALDGSLILGGWVNLPTKRGVNPQVAPAVWRQVGGAWQSPTIYAMPGPSASIWAISPAGVAVGRGLLTDGSYRPLVWDNATTYAVLAGGTAYGVNPAGTIAVGDGAGPVYWYRTAAGTWTTTGTSLPTAGGSCSGNRANDINAAGIIVGYSCVSSGRTLATVWRLDLSGANPVLTGAPLFLGGLGPGGKNTIAQAITSSPPYIVVGYLDGGSNVALRWWLP